jgi:hypothetical protein
MSTTMFIALVLAFAAIVAGANWYLYKEYYRE